MLKGKVTSLSQSLCLNQAWFIEVFKFYNKLLCFGVELLLDLTEIH